MFVSVWNGRGHAKENIKRPTQMMTCSNRVDIYRASFIPFFFGVEKRCDVVISGEIDHSYLFCS